MKLLLFALFVVGARCQGGIDPNKLAADFQKCVSDIQPVASDIEAFRRNEMPDSDKAKCFAACMFEQAGMIKNGVYDLDGTIAVLQQVFSDDAEKSAMATQAVRNCYNELMASTVTDKCELARVAIDCYQRNGPMASSGATHIDVSPLKKPAHQAKLVRHSCLGEFLLCHTHGHLCITTRRSFWLLTCV